MVQSQDRQGLARIATRYKLHSLCMIRVVPVMTDRLLATSIVNGAVFKTEMHLIVYINP